MAPRAWNHAATPGATAWLAEGISRSTWCRRRKVAREREALAARQAMFERAEAFVAALRRDLDRCATFHAIMARELAAASSPMRCMSSQGLYQERGLSCAKDSGSPKRSRVLRLDPRVRDC
jgi:hypothetical protein